MASFDRPVYSECMAPRVPDKNESRKPKLLDEVWKVLRFNHYSLRTEEAYVDWIRRFIVFHGKHHPREMGAAELRAFSTSPTASDGCGCPTPWNGNIPGSAGMGLAAGVSGRTPFD
jgi:Phage integrase, N-terminal SAM-like domain